MNGIDESIYEIGNQGSIKDPEGKVIGEHDGIFYYTIGQRIGSRYGIEIQKNESDKQNISYMHHIQCMPKLEFNQI